MNNHANLISQSGTTATCAPGVSLKHEEDIVYTENGTMMFNPYNEQNVEITLSEVQSILQKYGIPIPTVFNMQLYKRAFIHKSYTKRPLADNLRENITIAEQPEHCMPLKTKSNERLEFLGDGVLDLAVSERQRPRGLRRNLRVDHRRR